MRNWLPVIALVLVAAGRELLRRMPGTRTNQPPRQARSHGRARIQLPRMQVKHPGELEDALGDGWRVLTGPQEASDIAPFFRDVWASVASAS